MTLRSVLLASAAVAALTGSLLSSNGAAAAEIRPRGALDIELGGFFEFLAGFGDLREKFGGNEGSYDFRNDTEVHVIVRGTDEGTGIEYGVFIEFEADTDESLNTDETFLFIRGSFGEFRFGDEDGAVDNMRVDASIVAVGSGGIDGTIVDNFEVVGPTNSDDATKIIYYSPTIAGFQLGVSFTPSGGSNGQNIRQTNSGDFDDWIEGGLTYEGEFGALSLLAGVVAGYAQFNQDVGDDDLKTFAVGAKIGLFGFDLAGAWGTEEVAGDDRSYYNLGVATELGPLGLSATFGQCYDCDVAEPKNLVLGAEVGLFEGVSASIEVAFFDEDRGGNDDGVLGVGRLAIEF